MKITRLRQTKYPVLEPADFADKAIGLLGEARDLLCHFDEGGMHHPICDLVDRIGKLLDGRVDEQCRAALEPTVVADTYHG